MSFKILMPLIVVIVAVTVVLFYFHTKNLAKRKLFKNNGIQTEATVTDLERSYKNRRRLSGRLRLLWNYEIEVSYFTKNHEADTCGNKKILERDDDGNLRLNLAKPAKIGELVLTTIKVSGENFRKIKEGDRVEVLYLPDDIENAVLKSEVD